MANQIVVSAGAKVRNLDGVLTATSGVVSSLPIDGSLGIPQLDINGKILVSQLPNSVMEYKGTWDASTNTPTLANGTGNQGDVYLCNVAGTVNFGAGPIAFVVGDQVIYSGSIWQRASGATGTVTSVAITESGDSLNITGSPITTSGTINIGFNGTNLQYVNGAGNLTTFPTLTGYVPYSGATANVNLGEYGLSGGFIGFDTTPTSTPTAQGTMYWNADKESVDVIMNGVTGSVMQDTFYNVKNQTGTTITKGTIVRANGTVGASGRILIAPFLADGSYDSKVCLGVTAETILNGEDGKVTAFGAIRQIDTSAFANGTILYASPTTAGGFTSTEPTNPSNIVTIAIVVYSDVNNGEIFVRPTFVDNAADIAASLGYTPANDALVVHLAGTETITGAKTFTATSLTLAPTSGGGTLNLKQDAFLGATNGYTSLTSSGSDFAIIAATGVSTSKQAVFSLSSLGSTLRTYTLPDASGTLALTSDIPSLAGYVTLGTTQTITGAKTFSAYTTFTSTVDITSGLTFSNSGFTLVLQPPTLGVNRTVTLPNGTGTLALTSDISYPVTSVFGRSGAVVATSGDYTTAQVTESGNLYFTDSRARLAISLTTTGTSGAATYNNTTGVLNIPQYTDQFVGTVTSVAALTIGTSGTDLSSSVANSTTTPVITLNVPTASAANRGALSSADWSTFNSKQGTITLTTTGTSGAATFTSNTLNIPNYGSALSGYLPLTGGTLTGPLGGTSASFSSTVIAGGTIRTTGGVFQLFNSSTFLGGLYPYATWLGSGSDYAPTLASATDLYFATGDASSKKMILTSSGNLGLGVTPSAWSGFKAIQVNNASLSGWSSDNTAMFLGANNYFDGTNFKYISSNYANQYRQQAGDHYWFNAPSGTAGNAITFTQAMTLTAAGRLLLGTTTESTYLLDVNGTGRFSGDLSVKNASTHAYLNIDAAAASASEAGVMLRVGGTNKWEMYTANNDGNLSFWSAGQGIKFKIEPTGAATFSSSVTATNLILNGTATTALDLTSGSFSYALDFQNNDFIRQKNVAGTLGLILGISTDDNLYVRGFSGINLQVNNGTTALALTSGGNVLIGTTDDGGKVVSYTTNAAQQFKAAGTAPAITFSNTVLSPTIGGVLGVCTAANQFFTGTASSDMVLANQFSAGALIFGTSNVERTRITSGGYLKASNTGSYLGSTGAYHELRSNASDMVSYITNTNATPFGIEVNFTAASPNNTSSTFYIGRDSTTARFRLYSNGGLANYQANDVNLSDKRTKKDIIPLESYWDKFKAIEIVKFKYKDQTHNDYNIGVIAQQVESVAPEFIDVDGWGETPKDGIPLKSVYTADLHHATIRVLQECMAKIEEQQKQTEELKLKIK